MTATVTEATVARRAGARDTAAGGAPVARVYRFELVKLLSQWRIRLLLLVCWIVPAVFVGMMTQQSSLPADTLFGRWMHATGWAGSLVVLGFSGSWALPLVTSVVAGDVFSSEDRLGTWRHLLVAVRSPRRIFAAKALASLSVVVLVVTGLAVSSISGGLAAVGDRPLVGIDGHLLAPANAAGKVALAWACVLAPTLALAGLGLIGSIALGRSPIGLLVPALVALAMQVAQMAPLPVSVRVALPGYAFVAWSGLFGSPIQVAPLLISVGMSLVWAVVATGLAYRLFVRRDFANVTHDKPARSAVSLGLLPLAALFAVSVLVVDLSTGATASGIDQNKVQRSVAVAFAHLYRLQTTELNRPHVTEAQLNTGASCSRGGGIIDSSGAGNDWRCSISWHLPGVAAVTGTAIYQLDVSPNGRYIADGDGPQEVNGYFMLHTSTGDAPNPLWQFDGVIDLLAPTTKG
jgi:ABC-2 type transport system permease protein